MQRHRVGMLVARVSAGGWFEAYDLFMASYIALGLYRTGLFSPTGGMFVGTLLFGWISDRWGRRAAFTWSLLTYSLATLAMSVAPSALAIDAWRFAAGIGIGVQIITIDAYVSEIAPAADRGRYIALSQALTFTAVPCVALLAAWLVPRDVGGIDGWRLVSGIGALGAAAVWTLRKGLPETPRWLAARAPSTGDPARGSLADVFAPPYGGRTLMLVAFNVLQTFGYYGFTSWVTTLLYQEHVAFVHSLQYTAIIAFAYPLGPLLAMRFADRIERKWQIAALALAIAVFGLLFAGARGAVPIVLWGVAISLAINWFSSAFHAYQAELFPTRVRAGAVGFVYSWGRLSSIGVGFAVSAVLARFGASAVFVMIAAAMALVSALVAVAGPRTSRRELESIAP
jgi:MFS transporter, putative metabolite:H+ symporter